MKIAYSEELQCFVADGEYTSDIRCARWFDKPVKGHKMVTHEEAKLLPINNKIHHHKKYDRDYYDFDTRKQKNNIANNGSNKFKI